MFTSEVFGKRLTELRMKKGVSARDMSLSLGQCPSYIYNIESGHNLPSMASFFYICDYLGITPYDFFQIDNPDPANLAPLFESIKTLKPEQIQLLKAMLEQMK